MLTKILTVCHRVDCVWTSRPRLRLVILLITQGRKTVLCTHNCLLRSCFIMLYFLHVVNFYEMYVSGRKRDIKYLVCKVSTPLLHRDLNVARIFINHSIHRGEVFVSEGRKKWAFTS